MLAYWDKFLQRPDENEIQEILFFFMSLLNMNGNALRKPESWKARVRSTHL